MNYKVINSEIVYRGKVFDLQVDEIEYRSGNRGLREIAVHPGGVVILPLTDNGNIIMVSQFRYPSKRILLELPAGKLNPGEDPLDCALRELQEETGYTARTIENIGFIHTAPGFCTEILHIFAARDLLPGDHNREEGELEMKVHEYTPEQIDEKIFNGELIDSKTISALYMYKIFLSR